MRSLSASTLSVPLHCTCIETIKVFQNWFGTIVQWLLLTARTSAMGREGTFQSWPLGMTPTHLGICSGNWHTNFSTMGWNIFWKARRIEKIIHLGSGYFSSLDSTKSSVLSYAHKETHTFTIGDLFTEHLPFSLLQKTKYAFYSRWAWCPPIYLSGT